MPGVFHADGIPFKALPVGAAFRWSYHKPGHESPVCVKTHRTGYRKPPLRTPYTTGILAEVLPLDKAGLDCPACGADDGLSFMPPGRPMNDGERAPATCDTCAADFSVLRDADGGLYVEGA